MFSHYDHPARIMAAEAEIAALKDALREALDMLDVVDERWRNLCGNRIMDTDRIAELRKFLDDK